ncbi:MAG: aspartate kinase [Alphaproteobacteria bacterium]|nr:aspartate kinase [Alphaproteobacteria bacterium]
MKRIVMKFGGTSVASPAHIRDVAAIVKTVWATGVDVAVVVSAMGHETDRLDDLAQTMGTKSGSPEYDAILAVGEQVTAPCLALALQEIDVPARSWCGWQLPIMTTSRFGTARVESIEGQGLIDDFHARRTVAIVTGFQGIDAQHRITTLGRGGSDLSAVLLAAAIQADRCDIYTDVDGVYTSDPRIVRQAVRLKTIGFEEMLELAALGANVLQARSVNAARNHRVPLRVRSTFKPDDEGTIVSGILTQTASSDEDPPMELRKVTGIAHERNQAKITCRNIKDAPGMAARVFGPLSEGGIIVDMIVQTASVDGETTDITFTIPRKDAEETVDILKRNDIPESHIIVDRNVAKISIVGAGMTTSAGVAATIFEVLAERSINVEVISTSEIKVSVLISEDYGELALRALHHALIENGA